MKIYLAGGESRHWLMQGNDDMKLYLAGVAPWKNEGIYDETIKKWKPYILESFYYANEDTVKCIPTYGDFLLDSGAFTFMSNNKSKANWNEYINQYANFINQNNVKKFFELDIDSIVGYDKVLEYRAYLERLTNKQCIPVWHKSRGHDEFIKMCKAYSYVAIGGIVTGEIKSQEYKFLPTLIKEAHDNKAKIHGLGFTALNWLGRCHFDSVDSTAWTTGNRFGFAYSFKNNTMQKHDIPKGKKIADSRQLAVNNFNEWVKYQRYADTYL